MFILPFYFASAYSSKTLHLARRPYRLGKWRRFLSWIEGSVSGSSGGSVTGYGLGGSGLEHLPVRSVWRVRNIR